STLFMMPKNQLLQPDSLPKEPTRMRRTPMPQTREGVKQAVAEFLHRNHDAAAVTKPVAGMRFHSGEGVAFFEGDEGEAIVDHILMLSKHPKMEDIGGILLDHQVATEPIWLDFEPYPGHGPFAYWHGGKHKLKILSPADIAANPKA